MSLMLLWLFQLRVHVCTQQFTLMPMSHEQKVEICIAQVLKEERRNQ